MNTIVQLKFELVFSGVTVKHVCHNATEMRRNVKYDIKPRKNKEGNEKKEKECKQKKFVSLISILVKQINNL